MLYHCCDYCHVAISSTQERAFESIHILFSCSPANDSIIHLFDQRFLTFVHPLPPEPLVGLLPLSDSAALTPVRALMILATSGSALVADPRRPARPPCTKIPSSST